MRSPDGVLGRIVARKCEDVGARLAGISLDDLRARARPTTRSLAAALARPGARFIMEVKRVSPSEGTLNAAADPAALARAYRGAADAISVLVDTPYFGGSYADLEAVRAVFDGPILAKDFVVDPRQVLEARAHGADAVLVMLSVLDDDEAAAVMAEARRLGMDALVETHDEAELDRALALDARLIGINNRDLRTLTIDLAVTERLAARVPADRTLVSESGITDRADVARLAPLAGAFLVGSSLMKAADPAAAARALAFGRVKVCGLTSVEDVEAAAAAGATWCGLIMVPGTPRAVTMSQARPLADATRAAGAAPVGVFRDEKLALVAHAAHELSLAAVQLHGHEDRAYVTALRNMLPQGTEIWTSSAVDDAVNERGGGDRQLFDTAAGGRSGGTGQTFDWSRIAGHPALTRALLAGGLDPDNAREAAGVGAFALDVSSGVEASPGRKDPAKLSAFFQSLRLPSRGDAPCA